MDRRPRPQISVVTSLYRSEKTIVEFHRRVKAELARLDLTHEIILVNDGSPDRSLGLALELRENDPHLEVIDLSRNFGHHQALMKGLQIARGELVMLIDCDLEEPPELIGRFLVELRNSDNDVVVGVQQKRKGAWFERISGELFYRLYNALSEVPIPRSSVVARLMRRPYVRDLVRHRERAIYLEGLAQLTGYRQKMVPIEKGFRGETSYTFTKRMRLAVEGLTSFSSLPLVAVFYFGTALSMLSFAYLTFAIIQRLFFGSVLGWTTLIGATCLVGGVTIFSVGLVGLYVSKIFIEVKHRPYVIVREHYPQARAAANTSHAA